MVVAWNPGPGALGGSTPACHWPQHLYTAHEGGTMSKVDDEMAEPADETSEAENDARTGEEQAAINRENDPPA